MSPVEFSSKSAPTRGDTTAWEMNVSYRMRKVAPYVHGSWLDFGCADGGYSEALLEAGATDVVGVDVEADRIAAAQARRIPEATFHTFDGSTLPFENDRFDGAFANEVLEHVFDESAALGELRRVLRPDGVLILISPNRWFPFEGHAIHVGHWQSSQPTPLVPWLPKRISDRMVEARNYWPNELANTVKSNGFNIERIGFVWPVFEQWNWIPARMGTWYRSRIDRIDNLPMVRRFGVSTMIVARAAK